MTDENEYDTIILLGLKKPVLMDAAPAFLCWTNQNAYDTMNKTYKIWLGGCYDKTSDPIVRCR